MRKLGTHGNYIELIVKSVSNLLFDENLTNLADEYEKIKRERERKKKKNNNKRDYHDQEFMHTN